MDQLESWQSSRHGNWQDWLITGMLLANFRHCTTSATVPSSCLHEIAADHTQKHSGETPADCREDVAQHQTLREKVQVNRRWLFIEQTSERERERVMLFTLIRNQFKLCIIFL